VGGDEPKKSPAAGTLRWSAASLTGPTAVVILEFRRPDFAASLLEN
jgi:hypothetical protein